MHGIEMEMISAVFTVDGVVIPAQNEANRLYQDGYGSFLEGGVLLTLKSFEALYLIERARITVIEEQNRRGLVFRELLQRYSSNDPNVWTKYLVYRDLRSRGFVVREGPGRGVDFLVYERGTFGRRIPQYIIYAIWEGAPKSIEHLNSILEAAEHEDKTLRIAVVDRRGEIVYYTLSELCFIEE